MEHLAPAPCEGQAVGGRQGDLVQRGQDPRNEQARPLSRIGKRNGVTAAFPARTLDRILWTRSFVLLCMSPFSPLAAGTGSASPVVHVPAAKHKKRDQQNNDQLHHPERPNDSVLHTALSYHDLPFLAGG